MHFAQIGNFFSSGSKKHAEPQFPAICVRAAPRGASLCQPADDFCVEGDTTTGEGREASNGAPTGNIPPGNTVTAEREADERIIGEAEGDGVMVTSEDGIGSYLRLLSMSM